MISTDDYWTLTADSQFSSLKQCRYTISFDLYSKLQRQKVYSDESVLPKLTGQVFKLTCKVKDLWSKTHKVQWDIISSQIELMF